MIQEPDEVAAEVEEMLQRAGQGAGELGRRRALAQAQNLREAARDSEQRGAETRARFEAEHQAARAQVAGVEQEDWWQKADASQIVASWTTLEQWREMSPEMAEAAGAMRAEMIGRLGIDPLALDGKALAPATSDTEATASHASPGQPGPLSDRAAAVKAALTELGESQRLVTLAQQPSVGELVAEGGPRRSPRASLRRAMSGPGQERERGR